MFSWLTGKDENERKERSKWKEAINDGGGYIRDRVINIGSTIVYSTDYNKGQRGIVEYDMKTKKIMNVTKYGNNPCVQGLEYHSMCKCGENIYIIDGCEGQIIEFDLQKKAFKKVQNIERIGRYCSCIAINENNIYIFGGYSNKNGEYFVYNTQTNKVQTFKDNTSIQTGKQSLLLYHQRIIKFGGWDGKNWKHISSFVMSDPIINNSKIKWNKINEWTLPKPMRDCGVILIKNYVIIFGGVVERYGNFSNKINILDLSESKNGWKEIPNIQCPIQSSFRAIMTDNENIHLISIGNNKKIKYKYLTISLSDLLSDSKTVLCAINNNRNNECESKENELNCLECTDLRNKLRISETEKQSIQSLVNQLLHEQSALTQV